MRLRLRWAKLGKVRFTSHRDTARIWERALRRTGVRVATSEGFTPRPRISFGLALPTGAESLAEYLDLEVVDGGGEDLDELPGRLSEVLPVGITAMVAAELEPDARSLQEEVTSVTWELRAPADVDVVACAGSLLQAVVLPLEQERKGERRIDDVRPLIVSLATASDGATMIADLATIGRGLRPAELAALAFPGTEVAGVRVTRTHQWIDHDGGRREVLALPAVVAASTVKVGA